MVKMLIVDDTQKYIDLVKYLMKEKYPNIYHQIEFEHAFNAQDAHEKLKNQSFSAIITDNSFPASHGGSPFDSEGRNAGVALTKSIRSGACGETNMHSPILAMSTVMDRHVMDEFTKAGATLTCSKLHLSGFRSIVEDGMPHDIVFSDPKDPPNQNFYTFFDSLFENLHKGWVKSTEDRTPPQVGE